MVNDLAPRDRNLAMVFQNYALYPHLTVYENIAFPLRLAKAPDAEVDEKVRAASKTLDLDEHLERKPGNLSGGQRQRVAMGRAIVREADAFLFDEPLSNLDAKLRGQMRTEIARLQKRLGITTVYVTHDQTEAMTLGDRVAVLKRGILQQLATPRELYENPGNLFVAGFIGSPPMNFLPATVEGTTVKLPFGSVELPPEKAEKAAGKGLLMAGIRPEYFEDASVKTDPQQRLDLPGTTVDVVEWLGNETYAYIPFEAPPEVEEQLRQLERDLDGESLHTQLVVSLDGASRITEGEEAEIWVDGIEDAPLRPGHRREPHGRPRARRADPRARHGGSRRQEARPAPLFRGPCARPRRRPRSRRRGPGRSASSRRARSRDRVVGAGVAAHDPGALHHHVRVRADGDLGAAHEALTVITTSWAANVASRRSRSAPPIIAKTDSSLRDDPDALAVEAAEDRDVALATPGPGRPSARWQPVRGRRRLGRLVGQVHRDRAPDRRTCARRTSPRAARRARRCRCRPSPGGLAEDLGDLMPVGVRDAQPATGRPGRCRRPCGSA